MRSSIGKLASPKMPMPNVVVKTIVSAMMKAAVAAKTGWQRAANHNSIGNRSAIGTTVPQSPSGEKNNKSTQDEQPHECSCAFHKPVPRWWLPCRRSELGISGDNCNDSKRVGSEPMLPNSQNERIRTLKVQEPCGPTNSKTAVATTAPASIPNTWLSLSRLNSNPVCSIAMNSGLLPLPRAKTTALKRVRSPIKLATMVATIAPATTGNRARGPSAMRTPAATPEAGQNTATPSGLVRSRRLALPRGRTTRLRR